MYCTHCGSEIDNKAVVCVQCGVPTANARRNKTNLQQRPVNGFGIAGFILAILSVWLGCLMCVSPLIAFIFCLIGTAGVKKCGTANGLAIAGLVIAAVTLVFWGAVWTAYLTGYINYI